MNVKELRQLNGLTQKQFAELLGCSVYKIRKAEKGDISKELKRNIEKTLQYNVYTDGGCEVNPGGRGGYGVVIISPLGEITELKGGYKSTTNNRMEIMAILKACESLPNNVSATVFSDSSYAVKTLNGEFQKKKNLDLWWEVEQAIWGKDLTFKWIRGHSGNKFNERCDQLATEAYQSNDLDEDLGYDGPSAMVGHSKGAMSVDVAANDEKFANAEANKACSKDIKEFYRNGSKSFGAFLKIKVHGTDKWSRKKLDELIELVGKDVYISLSANLNADQVKAAMKWYCRGLALNDAIRKVLVDDEVSQNAINSRMQKEFR